LLVEIGRLPCSTTCSVDVSTSSLGDQRRDADDVLRAGLRVATMTMSERERREPGKATG
jgi:hypothetical protein